SWRAVARATRYRITVSGGDGELWRREVSGTELEYPADAPALPRDTDLLCELAALSDVGSIRKDETMLRVTTGEEAERVKARIASILEATGGPDRASARYLAGSYLAGHRLYRDAAEQFQALCAIAPEAAGPHEALGGI